MRKRIESLAILGAMVFAWKRLGLKVPPLAPTQVDPTQVAGVAKPVNGRCPAGWVKIGNQCLRL